MCGEGREEGRERKERDREEWKEGGRRGRHQKKEIGREEKARGEREKWWLVKEGKKNEMKRRGKRG